MKIYAEIPINALLKLYELPALFGAFMKNMDTLAGTCPSGY
jgi:hypothetical protein